ncbi:MAG: nitrate/nitrite transporter NrtS [Phycisphaerae bacterium]
MAERPEATPAPNPTETPGWLQTAWEPSIVRRAIAYALVVGTILVSINHGDAILAGDVSPTRLLRIGLTVMVPYLVSTCSSVGALRRVEKAQRAQSP